MFKINGEEWNLVFVSPDNPVLQRSDGSWSVGCTDMSTHTISIANNISGSFLKKVLTHELAHANMISRNVFLPIKYEEYLCDIVATFGEDIIDMSDCIFNNLKRYYGGCSK